MFDLIKNNIIVIPGKGRAHEFTDTAMYIMVVAVFFFIIRILLIVIDHYDKRDNESFYKNAKTVTASFGYMFFFIGILYALFIQEVLNK